VVAAGPDGELLHHWYADGWVGAGGTCQARPDVGESLADALDSSPAITTPYPGRIEAYVCRTDGDLWLRCYDGEWREWVSLGRPPGVPVSSSPAAASHGGRTMALVRGSDGFIWHKEFVGGRWRPWGRIGSIAASAPAIAMAGPGRAEAYVRGADGNMYTSNYDGRHWDQWSSLGAPPPGLTTERPAAISHPGIMDVYALANDHSVWHKRWSNGWQPWQNTEVIVGASSHRLTDAIYDRVLADTAGPLRGGALGTAGGFLTYFSQPVEARFDRAAEDEMSTLARFLGAGRPVSIGLLNHERCGHETVVFGGDIRPGGRSSLRVYDPNYPRCDHLTITVDPAARTITSSTGERWRALWVLDGMPVRTPPG
jgi:hypothetical protein